jgi:hypothetical protein
MARWGRVVVPKPVPLTVVPEGEDGRRRAWGEADRRGPRRINFRESCRCSSAAAHVAGQHDRVVSAAPVSSYESAVE